MKVLSYADDCRLHVSKEVHDAREECDSSDKALFSNEADVMSSNPAREASSNDADTVESREEGSVLWQSKMPSGVSYVSRRGNVDSTTSFLQRKPSRQADIPQGSTAGGLAKAGVGSLPDSKALELGNSRLLIKSNPAKATTQNESSLSNARKTKSTSEAVRKAVIDVLAHTYNMEEALLRALKSFGNCSTYWDQVYQSCAPI